mmetsp:Transcript_12025/g.28519  ORF Transcript_12025/g.28519 Transcript_12025/m.28519 type:complete len:234 (+) Transcript_12025:145-846(+)
MSNVRRRHNLQSSNDEEVIDSFIPGSGLSAKVMIDAAPQHHGPVQKLHIPVFYSILPYVIQRIILSIPCLNFFAPSWKERHLILCGSYLYKFEETTSTTPKGTPFEVEQLDTHILRTPRQTVDLSKIGNPPPEYNSIFIVSTLRRRHYYAVSDEEEAMLWIRSLHEARQECVRRRMGHASNMSYPFSWKHFDCLGESLLKSKNRVKDKIERMSREGIEMTVFTGGQIQSGFCS